MSRPTVVINLRLQSSWLLLSITGSGLTLSCLCFALEGELTSTEDIRLELVRLQWLRLRSVVRSEEGRTDLGIVNSEIVTVKHQFQDSK